MKGKLTSFFKVWDIKDEDGVAIVKLSTSRKVKDNGYDANLIDKGVAKNGYVNTYWSFVRFVGKAYNQLKKHSDDIENGIKITNLDSQIELEPYWDSANNIIAYPKNIKFTVFEFELANSEDNAEETPVEKPTKTTTTVIKNLDKAPKVEETPEVQDEEEERMPF